MPTIRRVVPLHPGRLGRTVGQLRQWRLDAALGLVLLLGAPAGGCAARSADLDGAALGNADIVEMIVRGDSDEDIVEKVMTLPVRFDLSTAALVELRRSGVTPAVIAAMMEASARPES